MATMGRKRKNNPLGLPDRVYARHGAFYYVHRDARWERLGTDLSEAKRKAAHYNDSTGTFGTLSYYLDDFILSCEKRVQRGDLADRTYQDYQNNIVPLKAALGHRTPLSIEAKDIGEYLDLGAEMKRPVRANREKACLSAAFSWMIRNGHGDVKFNPCIGVRRNRETPRERYVEHADYIAVREVCTRQVRGLLDLIYRTLQRPEDIIRWTPANIISKVGADGRSRRVIRNKQGKTGAEVHIEITPDIDAILDSLRAPDDAITGPGKTLIHKRNGKPYTYTGLCAMLRRYVTKAGAQTFSPYDLKGKGATDMWLSGVPLEQIQALCGHDSVKTTEVYVKCRWRDTISPNMVEILSNKTSQTL